MALAPLKLFPAPKALSLPSHLPYFPQLLLTRGSSLLAAALPPGQAVSPEAPSPPRRAPRAGRAQLQPRVMSCRRICAPVCSCPDNACSRALSSEKVFSPPGCSVLSVGIHSAITGPAAPVGNVLVPFLPALALSHPWTRSHGVKPKLSLLSGAGRRRLGSCCVTRAGRAAAQCSPQVPSGGGLERDGWVGREVGAAGDGCGTGSDTGGCRGHCHEELK